MIRVLGKVVFFQASTLCWRQRISSDEADQECDKIADTCVSVDTVNLCNQESRRCNGRNMDDLIVQQ